MKKIKVLLIEDRDVMRDTIKILMNNNPEIEISDEADDGLIGLEKAYNTNSDVILLDINLPFLNGFKLAEKLLQKYPNKKVLVYTMHLNDLYISTMLNLGVKGYVLKDDSFSNLVKAIKEVAIGNFYLSRHILNDYEKNNKKLPINKSLLLHAC